MNKREVLDPLFSEAGAPREAQRLRVLQALRRHGPMARVELGRATGLSPASVSALTAALIADGVLVEAEEADRDASVRGRPRVRLGFAPDAARVAALWVGLDVIELALADATGKLLASRRETLALRRLDRETLTRVLAERVQAFRLAEAPGRALHGLGVVFQGFVDATSGTLLWSPVVTARDVPLGADLARALSLPVDVENDAAAMTQAIVARDPALRVGRTVAIMMGDGIGLGLVVDGVPYRGARSGGSEFGHVRLDLGGPQCRCGGRGCVESYLADYALYRDAQAIADLPAPAGRLPSEADMRGLVERAASGDPALRTLFERAGERLAHGVALVIHMLHPDRIVVVGQGMRARALMETAFAEALDRATITELRGLTAVSLMDDDARLLTEGGLARALSAVDVRLAAGSL